MVELLKGVLGEALVFVSVGQRNGGHALMPVATVDQCIEFSQSVFEVAKAACVLVCSPWRTAISRGMVRY